MSSYENFDIVYGEEAHFGNNCDTLSQIVQVQKVSSPS